MLQPAQPDIRAAIVAEARTWLGTAYGHQQRSKGVRVDCPGLPLEVMKSVLGVDVDIRDYPRYPDGTMLSVINKIATPILASKMQPGDLAAIAFNGEPWHVGIITPYFQDGHLAMIHASNMRKKVIEHRLTPAMLKEIIAAWRLPGVPEDVKA